MATMAIMTFMVCKNGKVLQKDLGEKTKEVVEAIDSFDPDETWTPLDVDMTNNGIELEPSSSF